MLQVGIQEKVLILMQSPLSPFMDTADRFREELRWSHLPILWHGHLTELNKDGEKKELCLFEVRSPYN